MLNINASELLVLLVLIMVVVGPQRLPQYAETLATWVRQLRDMAQGARETVRTELGPDFDDVDWSKFDPRQYDPRRIVKDALMDGWDEPRQGSAEKKPNDAPGRSEGSSDSPAREPVSITKDPASVPDELLSSGGAAKEPATPVVDQEAGLVKGSATRPRPVRTNEPAPSRAAVPFDDEAT